MKLSNIFLALNATEQSSTTTVSTNEWNPEREYPQMLLAGFGLADLLTRNNKKQDHENEPS